MKDPAVAQTASQLRRAVLHLARSLRASQPPGGVTTARLSVLRWLHQKGPMTAGDIATADRLQPQSVTRLVSSLEQDGLIIRRVDATDRRRAVLAITPSGQKLLRAEAAHRDQWLTETMQALLSPSELALLGEASALLDRLAGDANEHEPR